MPKSKWNLNTIYISERLQESLRPISRCALTTVVAPMGYGKTTAVNWYLEQRAKAEAINVIRISVYSDNLEIFWKSVQNAFVRAVPAKDLTFSQSPIRMFLAGIRCNPTIGVAPFSLFQAVSLYSCGFALILAIRLLISSSVGMSISPIAVK